MSPGQARRCASVRSGAGTRITFPDSAKLRRVIVALIDGEDWSAMGADAKSDIKLGLTSAVVCGAAVLSIYSYGPQSDALQPEAT